MQQVPVIPYCVLTSHSGCCAHAWQISHLSLAEVGTVGDGCCDGNRHGEGFGLAAGGAARDGTAWGWMYHTRHVKREEFYWLYTVELTAFESGETCREVWLHVACRLRALGRGEVSRGRAAPLALWL